ncbi:MAG TPA: hypothetical protein VIH59_21620 [Candidatus Tectomicrobia bacterium]
MGYVLRSGRCEGLYVSLVSAQTLEPISLLRGRLHYALQPDVQLTVSAPDIADITSAPVQVRAVARPLKTYYRMDAVLPASRRIVWPVRDVLLPLHLDAGSIGVYGWVDTQDGRLYVPLRVVPQGAALPQEPIELVVRSTVDVETLVWRVAIVGQQASAWNRAGTGIPAGQATTITLPDGPRATLRLEVKAKAQNRDSWSQLSLRVFRDQL